MAFGEATNGSTHCSQAILSGGRELLQEAKLLPEHGLHGGDFRRRAALINFARTAQTKPLTMGDSASKAK